MLREAAYRLTQSARIGWFFTEYMLGRYAALSPEQRRSRNIPTVLRRLRNDLKGLTTRSTTGAPTFLDLLDDVRELMQRDLANIRAGIYGLPDDLTATPLDWLADARLYFADLPNVVDRRRRDGGDDIARQADPPTQATTAAIFITRPEVTSAACRPGSMTIRWRFSFSAPPTPCADRRWYRWRISSAAGASSRRACLMSAAAQGASSACSRTRIRAYRSSPSTCRSPTSSSYSRG
jgi:hypothetical protein